MALPTKGRVVIDTTSGELDIELWSKEAPKTCRNFIALALEGYYDGVIFHRIVPGFLIQTGDKTGTGGGGESFYGEPFEDEIHPRLRFPHRGIVAMANQGTKNTNDSQFFITLDRADELHGKHTIFGRCVGDTIYNAVKIGESEIGKDERPVYPPKIRSIRIVDNPFDDIIPRITAAERRAQQRAREQSMKEREEEIRRRSAKKNTKLLSFGGAVDDDEGEEGDEPVFKKKPIFRPDLVADSKPTNPNIGELPDFVTQVPKSTTPAISSSTEEKVKKQKEKKDEDITKIRAKHAKEQAESKSAQSKEITDLESQIRKLAKRTGGRNSDSDDSEAERQKKKKIKTNYVEDEIARYKQKAKTTKWKGKRRDESDVLAALSSFRGKLQGAEPSPPQSPSQEPSQPLPEPTAEGEDPMEIDDTLDFLGHKLSFAKDNELAAEEESRKAERDYEVIDPRVRGARAKEEERERKKKEREKRGEFARRGGRGRR